MDLLNNIRLILACNKHKQKVVCSFQGLQNEGDLMKYQRRLVYCNEKYHVILPNEWIKKVGLKKGGHVTLEIDENDFNRLIVKKSDE